MHRCRGSRAAREVRQIAVDTATSTDHFGAGEAGPELARELAEGGVGHPRHRGDVDRRNERVGTDFHGATSLSVLRAQAELEQQGDDAKHQDRADILRVDEDREQRGGGDEDGGRITDRRWFTPRGWDWLRLGRRSLVRH